VDAQDDPARFANTEVPDCGKLSAATSQSSGIGQRRGQTTHYRAASFDIACTDNHVGQLDLQLADNEPAIATFRQTKDQAEAETIRGIDPAALVDQAIRAVCSCGF
jgi:hypothetical protein